MEPLETDALLVDLMDPVTTSYRTVTTSRPTLDNNGRIEGRQHPHQTSTDDDEMLDIAMDGRDGQGMELPDKSHGELNLPAQ